MLDAQVDADHRIRSGRGTVGALGFAGEGPNQRPASRRTVADFTTAVSAAIRRGSFRVDSCALIVPRTGSVTCLRSSPCATGLDQLARALKNWSDSKRGKRKGPRMGFPRYKSKRKTTPSVRFTTGTIRLGRLPLPEVRFHLRDTPVERHPGRTGMPQQRPDLTRRRVQCKPVGMPDDHPVRLPAATDNTPIIKEVEKR
ncbi:hypothetical protein [Streptomyces sp. NBC_00271]|uniref:hypothetical protein n=1 Tax=Streptomyces sp. NBC_00271 TaxID=2975697 RepID=UPI002E2AF244|nr:hypothetical protein [Streptomyces sp. NBC_00271]